jgi:hypothetical protein
MGQLRISAGDCRKSLHGVSERKKKGPDSVPGQVLQRYYAIIFSDTQVLSAMQVPNEENSESVNRS